MTSNSRNGTERCVVAPLRFAPESGGKAMPDDQQSDRKGAGLNIPAKNREKTFQAYFVHMKQKDRII